MERTDGAWHLGDCAGVGAAWESLWARAEGLGASQSPGGWAVYTNEPTEVAPHEVETRLYLPLGDV